MTLKLKNNKPKRWQINIHTGSNVIQYNLKEKDGQKLLKWLTNKECGVTTTSTPDEPEHKSLNTKTNYSKTPSNRDVSKE